MNNATESEALYDMDGNCVCKLEGCAFCNPDLAEDEDYEDEYEPSTVYDMSDDAEIEPIHPDHDHDYEDNMTDAEADAAVLASAGWGTDEDYGCYDMED